MTEETKEFIEGMKKASLVAAQCLEYLGSLARPGIKTQEIDKAAFDFITSRGARPAPLNYLGYPKSICTSLNDVICHGVPDETELKEGDIINIDVTAELNGYNGDTSKTFLVGNVSENAKKITEAAEHAMWKGIEAIVPGARTGDIGFAINKYATRKGFWVVQEISGHGIGKKFHDEPFVPSFGRKGDGALLKPWKCITVEPMINETSAQMVERPIHGSKHKCYLTGDKALSAQFEHTILVTDTGYEVLTLLT